MIWCKYEYFVTDRRTCGAGFFGCPSNKNHCIFSRYLCDGVPDCTESEDESENKCGPGDPCTGKVRLMAHFRLKIYRL